MTKNVLVVLDKPNRPQTALKRAERIQRDSSQPVRLEAVSFLGKSVIDTPLLYDRKKRKALAKQLLAERRAWANTLRESHAGLPAVRLVAGAEIADWVADHCGEVDLVIKTMSGSRTHRSASDWALLSSCPKDLLMVGHKKVRQPKTVVAAVDLAHSDATHRRLNERVLEAAHETAVASGAVLHLAHALEVPPALTDLDIVDPVSAVRHARKNTQDQVRAIRSRFGIKSANVHFPVGPIGEAMRGCAKSVKADLLVVGTRARPIKEKLGLGNSAQRIVRKAPCDVLAIRP